MLWLKTFHTQALPSNQSCAYFTGSFWALNVLIFANCLEHNRSYILFITSVYEKYSLNFEKWSNASNYIYKVQNQGMKLCKPLGVPRAYWEFESHASKWACRKSAQVRIPPTHGLKGTRQGHGTQRKWKTQTFHHYKSSVGITGGNLCKLTSSDLKLLPCIPCFQKASTLSWRHTGEEEGDVTIHSGGPGLLWFFVFLF